MKNIIVLISLLVSLFAYTETPSIENPKNLDEHVVSKNEVYVYLKIHKKWFRRGFFDTDADNTWVVDQNNKTWVFNKKDDIWLKQIYEPKTNTNQKQEN